MPHTVSIERLFGGAPLIAPRGDAWESGVTFNSAAIFLEACPENQHAWTALLGPGSMSDYPQGIVVLHYRARPKDDPGYPWTRSFIGLSVHQHDLTLIRQFETPVVGPGEELEAVDAQGVEDPRVTYLDGAYWMVYCGVSTLGCTDPLKPWVGSVCLAKSYDLMNWTKCGPVLGDSEAFANSEDVKRVSNKDGVLFPDRIQGNCYLLHRPMKGAIGTWTACIAGADQPSGPFTDLGTVHGPKHAHGAVSSWVGAGSVPICISEGVYLSIEHTGNYLKDGGRLYVLDAFLYDFNDWDPRRPETLVKARLDNFMRPETDAEVYGPFKDSVSNVVFACGSYVLDGWIYIIYGGGDSYILGARFRYDELLTALRSQMVNA